MSIYVDIHKSYFHLASITSKAIFLGRIWLDEPADYKMTPEVDVRDIDHTETLVGCGGYEAI